MYPFLSTFCTAFLLDIFLFIESDSSSHAGEATESGSGPMHGHRGHPGGTTDTESTSSTGNSAAAVTGNALLTLMKMFPQYNEDAVEQSTMDISAYG